jgi:nucleoside-diphosphate kinase
MVDPETETLVILKPDCLERQLCGEVISRIERKGLKIEKLKITKLSPDLLEQHYIEHKDKPFYAQLVTFMLLGPVWVLIVSGDNVVPVMRKLVERIRDEYCNVIGPNNLVHASDSVDAASREIDLHF